MNDQTGMPQEAEGLVLFLLREGSRGDAVRVYQEETGARRIEAKRAVELLARRHGIVGNDVGFADIVLLGLMLVSLLIGLILR